MKLKKLPKLRKIVSGRGMACLDCTFPDGSKEPTLTVILRKYSNDTALAWRITLVSSARVPRELKTPHTSGMVRLLLNLLSDTSESRIASVMHELEDALMLSPKAQTYIIPTRSKLLADAPGLLLAEQPSTIDASLQDDPRKLNRALSVYYAYCNVLTVMSHGRRSPKRQLRRVLDYVRRLRDELRAEPLPCISLMYRPDSKRLVEDSLWQSLLCEDYDRLDELKCNTYRG